METISNHLQIAEKLLEQGKNKEAIPHLAKVLTQDPNHLRAWFFLGMMLEEPDKKKFAFEQVLKQNPQHQEAQQQLDILNGKTHLDTIETDVDRLRTIGDLINSGRRDEAINELRKYLDKHPRDEEGWYLLGTAFIDPVKQANAFKRVLRINPGNQNAAHQLQKLEKPSKPKPQIKPPIAYQSPKVRTKFRESTIYRLAKYSLGRAITIGLTIVIGVFTTVLIANKNGQLDANIAGKLDTQIRHEVGLINSDEQRQRLANALADVNERAGLNLPYLPRHLLFTLNALTFDWGQVMYTQFSSMFILQDSDMVEAKDIILDKLPNSLLLIVAANLFIFLVGIPVALRISRRKSEWQDKLFSFLAPISSIPSWIIAIILVLIFAIEMHLLPAGGMLDMLPPENKWEYVIIIGRHMILPVSAIVLSLIFQLIYTWRTFFLIYSNEDYVELARAKGLFDNVVEKKYILRPAAPFVITSFSLTLVGFWQMTIALERVFAWPGIGEMYIEVLPHFWGETMFPGEMILVVSLVVLFAYLLGMIVLILDIVYAMVDPRVRVGNRGFRIKQSRKRKRTHRNLSHKKPSPDPLQQRWPDEKPVNAKFSLRVFYQRTLETVIKGMRRLGETMKEMRRYPTAIAGLFIIVVLIIGSLYAIIALPYAEIGTRWYTESVTGVIHQPKLAQPAWTNFFRKEKLLSSITINSKDAGIEKLREANGVDSADVNFEFTFDYDFGALPEEMILRMSPVYAVKRPFVILTWITPDQREIEMKGFSVESETNFDLTEFIPRKFQVDPEIIAEQPYGDHGNLATLPLFVPPESEQQTPLAGKYSLRIEGMLFEEDSDIDAELSILGQVYGLAGTDLFSRDLLVPLLWGMPFALLFGLLGATITTILSMLLAATGTWFGGWVDGLLQRINEAVMILPILALAVLFYAFFNVSIWTVLGIMVFLNIFGSPTKAFRAAFLQVRESPFIEAAQAYGANNRRIILRYMIPRIIPVLIPQLVALIPSYVFLEATLGIFNIHSDYPTWGKVIFDALQHGVSWGSRFWVLEPIALLLLTGFAFAMVGFALDQILNPKLKGV